MVQLLNFTFNKDLIIDGSVIRTRMVNIFVLFFFYQNIDYNVQTNNLQSIKINQNNIKMSQTINITLQPMQ